MIIRKAFLSASFVFACFFPTVCFGQYIAHYLEKDHIVKDTLVDRFGVKYIIDKKRIYVTAVDINGKQLWKTDPVIDNKLEEYRKKRPTVVYFEFSVDRSGKNQVIQIVYENSQFGYLDKKTGKFTFSGQD